MSIVLTTGCFNYFHKGHLDLLNFCKEYGDVVVGINNNIYLYCKYGKNYTIDIQHRIKMLSLTKIPKDIIVFDEFNPVNLIDKIRPDIYIKGNDYKGVKIPEENILKELNIPLVIQETPKINSSSRIIFGQESTINFNK
jgi:D-beta-D-heptose 7-phosphate kinase/D-beta-D-heptose 1-phosphate adenosyltransferase